MLDGTVVDTAVGWAFWLLLVGIGLASTAAMTVFFVMRLARVAESRLFGLSSPRLLSALPPSWACGRSSTFAGLCTARFGPCDGCWGRCYPGSGYANRYLPGLWGVGGCAPCAIPHPDCTEVGEDVPALVELQ